MDRFRVDKWLWAARFYKTRAIAAEEIARGRILVNGQVAKASRELHEGDTVEIRRAEGPRTVLVRTLTRARGSAALAQTWYEETPESVALAAAAAERRKQQPEPALSIESGRPTKRDRRQLADWNRWSASVEPD